MPGDQGSRSLPISSAWPWHVESRLLTSGGSEFQRSGGYICRLPRSPRPLQGTPCSGGSSGGSQGPAPRQGLDRACPSPPCAAPTHPRVALGSDASSPGTLRPEPGFGWLLQKTALALRRLPRCCSSGLRQDLESGGQRTVVHLLNDVLTTIVSSGSAPTVSRQQEMDGLGRLISVCEIIAATVLYPSGPNHQYTSASISSTTRPRSRTMP